MQRYLRIGTLFILGAMGSMVAACTSGSTSLPPNDLSSSRDGTTYTVTLNDGTFDVIRDVERIRLKASTTATYVSLAGHGFERFFKVADVKTVINRQTGSHVNPVVSPANDCTPQISAHTRRPNDGCDNGGSPYLPDFMGCYDGPCGDDGDGTLLGVGYVLNYPGAYCYYDFPDDTLDCYPDNATPPGPPSGAVDLFQQMDSLGRGSDDRV